MGSQLKTILIWLVVFAALIVGYQVISTASGASKPMDQTAFYDQVLADNVKEITLTGDRVGYEVEGEFFKPVMGPRDQNIEQFKTYVIDEGLVALLREHGVAITSNKPNDGSFLTLLLTWSPMLLFLGVWIFFMRQMQSGGNKALSFGKSRAQRRRYCHHQRPGGVGKGVGHRGP